MGGNVGYTDVTQGPVYGEVVGADFEPTAWLKDGDDRIVIVVAVDKWTRVGRDRVVLLEADEFESKLPTADDVKGILG